MLRLTASWITLTCELHFRHYQKQVQTEDKHSVTKTPQTKALTLIKCGGAETKTISIAWEENVVKLANAGV